MTGAGPHGSGMHHTVRTVREGIGELGDPARLRALEHLGLTADADERMDELADWVREALGVPVALVSLVQADVQVFPGMVGLAEPWASKRSTRCRTRSRPSRPRASAWASRRLAPPSSPSCARSPTTAGRSCGPTPATPTDPAPPRRHR